MGRSGESEELRIYEGVLGHPREECPPDYYRLLGVSPDEKDSEKIKAGAGERMARLRLRISAEQVRSGRAILKRIQRAQICLLDPQARAAYDATLIQGPRAASEVEAWAELPELRPEIPSFEEPEALGDDGKFRSVAVSVKRQSHERLQKSYLTFAIVGTCCLLVAIVVAISQFGGGESETLSDLVEHENARPESPAPSAKSKSQSLQPSTSRPAPQNHNEARIARTVKPVGNVEADATAGQPAPSAINSFRIAPDRGAETSAQASGAQKRLSAGIKSGVSESTSAGKVERTANTETLAQLPLEIALPELRSVSTSLSNDNSHVESAVDLGPVPSHGLEMAVDQPKVMAIEGVRFSLIVDRSYEAVPAWLIRLSSTGDQDAEEKSLLDDVGLGFEEDVARLYVDDGRLKFVWIGSDHLQMAEQLRNCVITVQYQGQQHRLQLRECQDIAPVVLDFENNSLVFEAGGSALPAPEATFLHLENVQCGGANFILDPDDGIIPCQKNLSIKLLEGDQQLEIRMTLRSSNGGYKVIIAPRYRLGSRWQVFSTEKINDGLLGLRKAMSRQQKSLAAARSAVSTLPGAISSARSGLSSDDPAVRFRAKSEVSRLTGRLVRAKRNVDRAQRAIADINSKEAILGRFVELGDRLRGATEISFRVAVATENGDLNLLRTSPEVVQRETNRSGE